MQKVKRTVMKSSNLLKHLRVKNLNEYKVVLNIPMDNHMKYIGS